MDLTDWFSRAGNGGFHFSSSTSQFLFVWDRLSIRTHGDMRMGSLASYPVVVAMERVDVGYCVIGIRFCSVPLDISGEIVRCSQSGF